MKDFLKSGKMIVSAVLALLGAVAATIAIVQFTETKPSETWIVERDSNPIEISANGGALRDVYQADIVHVLGDVPVEKDIAIIANEIIFKNGASLQAPGANITLIATRIRGGTVNASGKAVAIEGSEGRPGGSIFVVAALLNGSRFMANGGRGAQGTEGAVGADGKQVECEARGFAQRAFDDDELAPNDGRPGVAGGAGGAGGKGGVVKVYGHPNLFDAGTSVAGGTGGAGGNGGPGGHGAAGCSLFGFAIEDGDEGQSGLSGPKGNDGPAGRAEVLKIDFRSAGLYLKKKLKTTPPSAAQARQLAELAAAAGLVE